MLPGTGVSFGKDTWGTGYFDCLALIIQLFLPFLLDTQPSGLSSPTKTLQLAHKLLISFPWQRRTLTVSPELGPQAGKSEGATCTHHLLLGM
jgi:hypothetical protein